MSEKSHSHSPNPRAAKNKRLPYEKSDSNANGKKTENRYKGAISNRKAGKTVGDDARNGRKPPRIQEVRKCGSASFGEGYIDMHPRPERHPEDDGSTRKQTMVDKSTQTVPLGRIQLDKLLSLGGRQSVGGAMTQDYPTTDTGAPENVARGPNSNAVTPVMSSPTSSSICLPSTSSSDTTGEEDDAIYNSLEQAPPSTQLPGSTGGLKLFGNGLWNGTQVQTLDELERSYENSLKKLLNQMCNISESQQ